MGVAMTECPHCEFPLPAGVLSACPKCGVEARGTVCQGLLEVDVAHSGETWDMAREKIVKAVDEALQHGHSGVKIIHGWGSSTGQSVLSGLAKGLLRSFAVRYGGRMAPDRGNPGAHILWLNR